MVRALAWVLLCTSHAVVLQNHQAELSAEASKMLDTLTTGLLNPELSRNHDLGSTMRALEKHMDVKSAAKAVAHRGLAPDVQNLVQRVASETGVDIDQQFDDASLEKARKALNDLIEKAWVELDNKIMVCKGFEDMNRENYNQVVRDINRLIGQINDLERIEAEAVDGIAQKETEITIVQETLRKETASYMTDYAENKADLTKKQNDLDVFQFILEFTKCKDATSLTQVKLCQTPTGQRTFVFEDTKTNAKYQKLLTPTVKREVSKLLGAFVEEKTTPVEKEKEESRQERLDRLAAPATTLTYSMKTEVKDGTDPDDAGLVCNGIVPDCALLHDKLSLLWGEFKDKVDELTMEMMKNEFEFNELRDNLNSQVSMLSVAKAKLNQLLAEARSNLANDREELDQKYAQKAKLDVQYTTEMAKCKKRIDWIFYQDMCAIKAVRNAVMENATTCPTASITDCDVGDWVPSDCTKSPSVNGDTSSQDELVTCDNTCDPFNRASLQTCGGWAPMTREVVVKNDKCGVKCPALRHKKRCGQFQCPVNCAMSDWSSWSKCTAECGGGLRSHTRSILVKPKNGGLACNTVEESESCATGSCDRNCLLAGWTSWSPCSVACGGGFQEKHRHVAIPTRGRGRCPTSISYFRYRRQGCNEQPCRGDEICVANQDLIVAIDGSGSVREPGFKTLKNWVVKLLDRYESQYWGSDAVKVGLVQFGNGVIMTDGTVSPAVLVEPLTTDLATVKTKAAALPFKKGFTNMAQAFSTAETAFIMGSRRGSQQAVMVVSDGLPSFKFMTQEMVTQLDDKGIQRYFFLVNADARAAEYLPGEGRAKEQDQGGILGPDGTGDGKTSSDAMAIIKQWASQPWETNLIHVPGGAELLESDMDLWADKALVKFCPNAYSPSEGEWEEINYGYAHVMDGGYCGDKKNDNFLGKVDDVEQCAALVAGAAGQSFIYGVGWSVGKCYKGTVDVDTTQFNTWLKSKSNPQCPGDKSSSTLFDFYAMEPVEE